MSVASQAVASGTSFLTSVLIGRTCSKEVLGTYALAFSIVIMIRGVQADAVLAPYTIYCSRRRGAALATYTGSTLVHQFGLTVVGLAGLLALAAATTCGVGPADLASALWVLLAALPFLLLREFVRQLAFSHLRAGEALLVDAAAAAVQLSSLGLLAYFGRLNVPTVYAIMGGTCALVCFGWHLIRREPVRFEWSRIAADWRTNWAFARWALASQLLGRAWSYLMPWVVALNQGEAATATFAVAVTLVNLAGTFVTGVSNFVTPRTAHAYNHGGLPALRRVLWQTAALYATTVSSFCLVVLAAGEPMATLVYGGRYAGVGPVLTVLAFAMLANSLSITAGTGLWALDRPRASFLADGCSLLATAVVLLALIGPMGVMGAALATLVGSVAGAAVRGATLWRLMAAAQADAAVAPSEAT